MRKKSTLFGSIFIFISLLVSIGCTATQEVELVQPVQTSQITRPIEDSTKNDIAMTETVEEPSVEVLVAPLLEEDVATEDYVFTEEQESVLDADFLVEGIESLAYGTSDKDPIVEIINDKTEELPVVLEEPEPSSVVKIYDEPVDTKIDPNVEPSSAGHSSFIPEAEIERSPMISNIYLLGLIAVLIIILIVLIQRLRKVKRNLESEQNRIQVLGVADIESGQKKKQELEVTIDGIESQLIVLKGEWVNLKGKKGSLEESCNKLDKRMENQRLKLARAKELHRAIEHAVERFHETDIPTTYFRPLTDEEKVDLDSIAPTIMLNLNYMNYQDLRKEFRANQKQIDVLLEDYAQRYTTKANQAIYQLMVISLRSELQNILYNLKYEKLDNALFQVQSLIAKYLVIASDGNQQIAGTMRKFVGELEHLFDNAVRIEYEYYLKREQARQEQLALRQQMREEAEERKRLAEQKEQIAFEESKYLAEIEKIQEMLELEPEDSSKRADIMAKLEELNIQLAQVEEKKEEITKLQKGKAGNVYIISNLGSFGDQVFKIGMTRRLDPQERVNELSNASVPFKYDVHSFIFSEDAVGLENKLHQRLHARRLNKVNLRKEFFDISLEELEQLVEEINPTAEFNRTMLAEDYKQSLSMGDQELPLSDFNSESQDEEDEDDFEMDEE
jgi:hypothetical protein